MKYRVYLLTLACGLTVNSVCAAAVLQKQVSSDAKWLLHVDLQSFRRTQVGEFLTKGLLEKATGEVKSKIGIDVGEIVKRISSVTAYGTDFEKHPETSGVLLVQMDAEAQKILEGFLAAQMLADSNGAVKKVQQDSSVLYSVRNDFFLAVQANHLVVLGKSRKQIDKATDVLAGKAPDLTASEAFAGFPPAPDAFFFLAIAEGFNENNAILPQAKVLQMAEGGRVVIGEKAEKLFLNLALRTKNSEVGEQIQQVFEGIRAMVTLSQAENQDLQELVRSIKVSNTGKMVTVNAEFPVAPVIKKIAEKVEGK